MFDTLEAALRTAIDRLVADLDVMPLDRWNESVFRHYVCRAIAERDGSIEQFIEADRIDLVLQRGPARAFVEFKFFIHRSRVDPYDGQHRGFKGGPSLRIEGELSACIDRLNARPEAPNLSKCVVVFYADPDEEGGARRYAEYLDRYEHPSATSTAPIPPARAAGHVMRTRIFEIG